MAARKALMPMATAIGTEPAIPRTMPTSRMSAESVVGSTSVILALIDTYVRTLRSPGDAAQIIKGVKSHQDPTDGKCQINLAEAEWKTGQLLSPGVSRGAYATPQEHDRCKCQHEELHQHCKDPLQTRRKFAHQYFDRKVPSFPKDEGGGE